MSGQRQTPSTPDPSKPIDASWRTYLRDVMPANAGANQVTETRRAFYAGAATLFSSIMSGMDPGTEPTDADLARMDAIARELEQYAKDLHAGLR